MVFSSPIRSREEGGPPPTADNNLKVEQDSRPRGYPPQSRTLNQLGGHRATGPGDLPGVEGAESLSGRKWMSLYLILGIPG